MNSDLRLDTVMKSIDVLGRLAFGGQCVAAMMIVAGPLIFVTACIVPFFVWGDNHGSAIAAWLGGWAAGVGTTSAGIALGVFCWRWSGDWITEWYGYAVAFGVAAVANVVLAYMLTSTPIPVPGSLAATIGGAFAVGFLVAGHLGGLRVLPEQRAERQREIARRR